MITDKLLAIALVAALLVSGVAGVGAVAAQEAPGQTNDDGADAGGPPADVGSNQSADRPGPGQNPVDASERGPPLDLPAHVPDHVVEIHQTIHGFLNGEVENLGGALSELLSDVGADDAAEADADDEEETEDEVTDGDGSTEDDADA